VALFLLLRTLSPSWGFEADESLVQAPWSGFSSGTLFFSGSPSDWISPTMEKAFLAQFLYTISGVLFLGTWMTRGGRRSQSHQLLLGLLFMVLSIAGASVGALRGWEWNAAWLARVSLPALIQLWWAVVLCGGALVFSGLLDHGQLVRALGTGAAGRREESR